MITYLRVIDYAIIKDIEIDFKLNMTTLTGETGAGKSLLIDSIGLLTGDRADKSVIRTGAKKAIIEGIFKYNNKKIDLLLKEFGIDFSDQQLIIRREISITNNITRVNNVNVTLKQLKSIMDNIIDIHTQFDTHKLLETDNYLDIVDGFIDDKSLFFSYSKIYSKYRKVYEEYNSLIKKKTSSLKNLDMYEFELKELQDACLVKDEKNSLKEDILKLDSYSKIYTAANSVYEIFNNFAIVDNIFNAKTYLDSTKDYDKSLLNFYKVLGDSYYQLEDMLLSLKDYLDNMVFDSDELDRLNSRLYFLETLEKKYNRKINKLIEYKDLLEEKINDLDNYDNMISSVYNKVDKVFESLLKKAMEIHDLRALKAKEIKIQVEDTLSLLELKNTVFEIELNTNDVSNLLNISSFTNNGIDSVEILISTNGGVLLPLSKTLSGGEMSRVMFALKAVLNKSLNLSTIVFDEIDIGISGLVAYKFAKVMKNISLSTQVLCITHLPQVASFSNQHLFVSKSLKDKNVNVDVCYLDYDGRVKEIAKMLSGNCVGEYQIESARELLKNAF